ncbi:MAG TPA: glycosyltransferase family 87 protein [Candidatus Sulfotelmatobacter sp.]|nr:glycosyltransferase family 87 protein [Candidatus Sulfotelmatobacter sp.]
MRNPPPDLGRRGASSAPTKPYILSTPDWRPSLDSSANRSAGDLAQGFLRLLTPRRVLAQALVLALCLWGVCAADFATPTLFDRAGNIKFQDFLPVYISARLITQHRAADLYDPHIEAGELHSIIHRPTGVQVPNLYGPQVGLLFFPLAKLSFSAAALLWAAISVLIYFACIYAIRTRCLHIRSNRTIFLSAIAFPPLFHFFLRGQISPLLLLAFTLAFLALSAERPFLAGLALGLLFLKPQFLIAIPLILYLSRSWKLLAGLILSATAQLAIVAAFLGPAALRRYLNLLLNTPHWIDSAELSLAPIQMHSLRSFWTLLIPSSAVAATLYVFTAIFVIALATAIWKSSAPLVLRFSALTLAAVLVDPHLFIYDLIVLAPVFLLLFDWTLEYPREPFTPILQVLLYLSFILPLFGPLARWSHLQLSVPVFVALLWALYRLTTPSHKLASAESSVV